MQDLAAILLAYLLIGYGSSLATYLILRRTAHRDSAGRPIIQIPSWKISCWLLTVGLFSGATEWIIAIASLFADLVSSLNETCPLLIRQDECRRAALDWQTTCVWLVEGACAAFCIIIATTHAEAKRTESPPERAYPLVLLTCSHCLLVASWLLCTPLTYRLKLFSLVGPKHWTTVSSAFAFAAIMAYIFGTALGVIALIRVVYAWRRRARDRTPAGAQWSGDLESDVVLQDV